jgi:DHA1 family bicyclomycin/chloramphenicol resistance-like MFS transporter
MSYVSASPFVYQNVLGIPSQKFAFFFATNAMGLMLGSVINNQLLKRFTPWQILWTAQRINLGIAMVLLLTFLLHVQSPYIVAPMIFCLVMTMSFILGNGSALAVQQAPHAIGSASAILGALFFMFGAAVSPLTGLAGTHAAWPMALTQTACALVSLACLRKAHQLTKNKATQKST